MLVYRFCIFNCLTAVLLVSSCWSIAQQARNIVIVHGAFADGSDWRGVHAILKKKGYIVTVVQNPLTSLKEDVEATIRFLLQHNFQR